MFQGRKFHSLDKKGRVAVPEEYRRILGEMASEDVILTRSADPDRTCVVAWPRSSWDSFCGGVTALRLGHPVRKFLDDMVISTREICTFDVNGRILIPQFLRTETDLAGRVVFIGRTSCFEIWSADHFADVERRHRDRPPSAEELADLELY